MYVHRAIRAADPADSHVQARTAPSNPQAETPWPDSFPSTGNDRARTTQPNPSMHPGRSDTTGIAGPIHLPSIPMHPPCTSHRPLTHGNEADSEVVRDPMPGELLSRPQRASQDRSPDLFDDLIDDRRGLDRPHAALADLRFGSNVLPDASLTRTSGPARCHLGGPRISRSRSWPGYPADVVAGGLGDRFEGGAAQRLRGGAFRA
jgi:hypothetical protein